MLERKNRGKMCQSYAMILSHKHGHMKVGMWKRA